MNLRIATADGLVEPGSRAPVTGPVRVFGDVLIAGDRELLWYGDAGWTRVGEAPGLRCAVDAPGGVLAGTEGAHLLRLRANDLVRLPGFETAPGRDEWYTPWGGPPEVRSLACTPDNVLFANVHVGGILRSDDAGRSWTPTVDVDLDVHQVRSVWGRDDLLVAAAAVGLLISADGGHSWRVHAEGLDGTYCRAVAAPDAAILVSASEGPRGRRSAIYRTDPQAERPFERVSDWMDANVDTHALDGIGEHVAFGTATGEVWESTDTGTTWSRTHTKLATVTSLSLVPG